MIEPGKYVVIEGSDGTGKSTQVELLADWLAKEKGIDSFIAHEPAGTPMADAIRDIIKNGNLERDPVSDLLLFTAARREIWREARQALKLGNWVLSARNYLSTEAYQGYGDGVDLDLIRSTTREFVGQDYLTPDHTFILSINSEEERAARIDSRGELDNPDTFEMRDASFQSRVNQAYIKIARSYGISAIDAARSVDEIHEIIKRQLDSSHSDTLF